ncbi:FRG domain-containing protein [Paenibacillus sp. LMG 31459]|uniref:FRG domain-containing protein n=1 Tax=Paenibacillus phytohabitans TaxID=2654978 RepID=A0ABX1YKN2_9BACL|nr:FRG domain-containing protein [Paenibacillus phytohabitans]NOU80345.1 FRG domain-containing protein [Paenibacillus phytohabitans]
MQKYIYISTKIRKNSKTITKLIEQTNEAVIWYISKDTNLNSEAYYFNNKNGTLKRTLLSTDILDIALLDTITYTESMYMPVNSTMNEICVLKVDSLIKYIEIIDVINDTSDFVFRGQKDKTWSLKASIFRNGYNHNKEYDIYREIRKNRFEDLTGSKFLDNLIHMQHYGIPTRLLDWSRNPLIPLFFACSDNKNDGKIFAYKPNIIYEFDQEQFKQISTYLNEDFNRIQLNPHSIKFLASIFRGAQPDSIFIESTIENERLKAQRGLFSIQIDIRPNYIEYIREEIIKSTKLFSKYNKKNLLDIDQIKKLALPDLKHIIDTLTTYKTTLPLDGMIIDREAEEFLKELTQVNYWKQENHNYDTNLNSLSIEFIIPKEYKNKIRKQLESLNINSMTVYPDFFGFVQYINDKYEG